jgi:hypothetical protein
MPPGCLRNPQAVWPRPLLPAANYPDDLVSDAQAVFEFLKRQQEIDRGVTLGGAPYSATH